MAMEDVAGMAERLAKDRVTTVPPQPFRQRVTPSLYSKVYSEDGREARNKRAEQRRLRATGIEKLGEEEYKRLLQEIDKMTQTPVNIEELINKRMKELAERLEAQETEKEAEEKQKSKDRPGTSTEAIPRTRSSTRKGKSETDTDKSESRKADPQPKPKVKQSEQANKRGKRSAAIPMIEDDDDDDDDLKIIEKTDKVDEPEEDDEDAYQIEDDDNDDDFQEPPPRSRKKVKQSKKPTDKRRIEKSTKKKDEPEDKTLALFQRLVGPEFEVRASEEFEIDPKDKCGNPVEAAGFRATMKMLALGLKEAVKKGKNIEETYTDMINSTIEVAKAMNYPGASKVTLKEVLPAVKDLKCSAWRKYLKGDTKMDPADVQMEDDGQEDEGDLVIQGPILGKEATEAAAEAIHKLPPMLLTDTKRQLKNLFEHMMKAHQHAAEASKCLKELHEQLPLDVFLRIADSAVRPLVVLHVPKTERIIEKLKETAMKRVQEKRKTGSTEVTDVMIARNLPQCSSKWTAEEEYRPRKMIASIVYKYVREAMFKGNTVTQKIVDEFGLPKTTIHRQLFGKKYPGGGQTLEKLRREDKKVEASGSGKRKVAVILEKTKVTEEEPPSKKGKGPGKKSGKERSAKDIRGAATAESEKQKREIQKQRAQEEEEELEEDPDRPTRAEIRASKPASKALFIH